MAVTGYGRAPKDQVQTDGPGGAGAGQLPRPDDAADALAVAICPAHGDRPPREPALSPRWRGVVAASCADSAGARGGRRRLPRVRGPGHPGRPREAAAPQALHPPPRPRGPPVALRLPDEEELGFFELLITVTGVGPRWASAIVSSRPVADLQLAIVQGDEAVLTAVSGVGKRLAAGSCWSSRRRSAAARRAGRCAGSTGRGRVGGRRRAPGARLLGRRGARCVPAAWPRCRRAPRWRSASRPRCGTSAGTADQPPEAREDTALFEEQVLELESSCGRRTWRVGAVRPWAGSPARIADEDICAAVAGQARPYQTRSAIPASVQQSPARITSTSGGSSSRRSRYSSPPDTRSRHSARLPRPIGSMRRPSPPRRRPAGGIAHSPDPVRDPVRCGRPWPPYSASTGRWPARRPRRMPVRGRRHPDGAFQLLRRRAGVRPGTGQAEPRPSCWRPPASAARPRTTCCSTARPAWARPRSPTSSPASWA